MRRNPTPVPAEPSGVYAIRHLPTNRVYVGSSRTIRRRWKSHLILLRKGTHYSRSLQDAWNKDGPTAFVFEVIEPVGQALLVEREQHWLTALDVTNPNVGFNLSKTSVGSSAPHTKEWKRARSAHALRFTSPILRSVTEEQATEIAHAVAAGESDSSVARRYGIPNYTVSRIARGFIFKHLDIPRRTKGEAVFQNNRSFTREQVVEIRRRKAEGERTAVLVAEFNSTQATIDRIASRFVYRDF